MQLEIDARIAQAIACVKEYGLDGFLTDPNMVERVRRNLGSTSRIVDDDRRKKACESVYSALTSDTDTAIDLLFASQNYAAKNGVSINKATVILVRELVFALASKL